MPAACHTRSTEFQAIVETLSEVIAELTYLVRWERWKFGQYGLTDRVRTRCEFSDVLGQVENHASVIDNDNP